MQPLLVGVALYVIPDLGEGIKPTLHTFFNLKPVESNHSNVQSLRFSDLLQRRVLHHLLDGLSFESLLLD